MTGSKIANKVLAILLILVMYLTNPAFIGPIYAESTGVKESTNNLEQFNLDAKKDAAKNTAVNTATIDNNDSRQLTDGERFNQFFNRIIPYYLQGRKKLGSDWLKTTDFELAFDQNYKPMYSLTTIQPFGKVSEKGELWFWQGRYAYQSDNNTANFGIGWRKISKDKQQMVGLNLFYDYGFKYNLSRIGAGVEYFNKLAEYRANIYVPTSGDKQTGVVYQNDGILYSYIRAVQGFDYEAGTSFTHARWLKLFASGYFYDNKYRDKEIGYRLRSVMQLTPRFSLEAGYDKSNLSRGGFYGKFTYQLANGFGASLKDKKEDKALDLSGKFLQKVERNNTIKTETFTKFLAYQGSINVKVVNAGDEALQGAKVQAYAEDGSMVGATAVSDENGTATIGGLNAGKVYTVKVTYFDLSQQSNPVTVQKDQTVSAQVRMPIASNSIQVSVQNAALQSVSGATVTAEATSQTAQVATSWLSNLFGMQKAYAAEAPFSLTLTTGVDGTVTFKNLPLGTYKFTAKYDGQVISSTPLSVQAGGTVNTNIVMTPVGSSNIGSAVITIQDEKGMALSGATVDVVVDGRTKTVTTNDRGLGVFSDLPAGNYTFVVSKANYGSQSVSAKISDGITTAVTGVLRAESGSATITVMSGSSPLSGAVVTVDGTSLTGTTNDSGVVTINNIPAGNYTFTASKNWYISSTSASTAIVNGGTAAVAIALMQQPQVGSVSVTLNGTTSASDYTVTVKDKDNVDHVGTVKSGSPTTTIGNIPAGSCTVTVTAPAGYNASVNPSSIIVENGKTATVSITSSSQPGVQTYNITASAGSGGSISPSGATAVVSGGTQRYTITADATHTIASITVDSGLPSQQTVAVTATGVGGSQNYDFTNVTGVHTIAATFAALPTYNITASAGIGGSISPSGAMAVVSGGTQRYTITADATHTIASITVDSGLSTQQTVAVTATGVGGSQNYDFTSVTGAHTIAATFAAVQTYNITASAGSGGSISPSGTTAVTTGGTQRYTITADATHTIATITVDSGLSTQQTVTVTATGVGATQTYDFTNVTGAHTIAATFAALPTYNITASAGSGGSISPSGTTAVTTGGTQRYTITADATHTIATITVDSGLSTQQTVAVTTTGVGATQTYDFTNVTGAHTIAATFAAQAMATITFSVSDSQFNDTLNNGQYCVKYIIAHLGSDNSTVVASVQVVGGVARFTLPPLTNDYYAFYGSPDGVHGYTTYMQAVGHSGRHVDAIDYGPLTLE